MIALSYADREAIFSELERLSEVDQPADEVLITRASDVLREVEPTFELVGLVARDITALGELLRRNDLEEPQRLLVRGVLTLLIRFCTHRSEGVAQLGMRGILYVTRHVLHELQTQLSITDTHGPLQLTAHDRERAEQLFLEFWEEPVLPPSDLIREAMSFRQRYEKLEGTGMFGRLLRNVDYLVKLLGNESASSQDRALAGAALSYLVTPGDAIHDSMGMVGYLDDAFILATAVEMIDPQREPWLDLLDSIVEVWPFLNGLVFHDAAGSQPASEYLIINSALACQELRSQDDPGRLALVVPFVGPTPLLVAVLAALGSIQQWISSGTSPLTFSAGDTVRIDNAGRAHFEGFEEIGGRQFFGLSWWSKSRGKWSPASKKLPIEHLQRLTPAAMEERPRGPVTSNMDRSRGTLGALEYIFDLPHPPAEIAPGRRVVLVTQSTRARQLADTLFLCGHRLTSALPVGHVMGDGEIRPWSDRFTGSDPVLLVVSDLDDAVETIEENPDNVGLVIVDLQGTNTSRAAGLAHLAGGEVPILAISRESDEPALELLQEQDFTFWEWTPEELHELVWPRSLVSERNLLSRYERRVRTLIRTTPEVISVSFPEAATAFEELGQLRALLPRRGGDLPAELDTALEVSTTACFRLLQFSNLSTLSEEHLVRERKTLAQLDQLVSGSAFLTPQEREAVSTVASTIRTALEVVRSGSPRTAIIREILERRPDLRVFVRNSRIADEMAPELGISRDRFVETVSRPGEDLRGGALIAGWLNQKRMRRLLHPPVASPLVVVLYEVEKRWFDAMRLRMSRAQARRRSTGRRERLFPTISGWKAIASHTSTVETPAPDTESELELLDWHEITARRNVALGRATNSDSEPECETRLVWFSDGSCAFLTPGRRLPVATHLLDAIGDGSADEDTQLEEKRVEDLQVGDLVLFVRGAPRDVIRSAADRLLPDGARTTAGIWRTALVQFADDHGLSAIELAHMLGNAGCRRHPQTVSNWLRNEQLIAPRRALTTDLDAIAEVTGDDRLVKNLDRCKAAIHTVRSAHMRASRELAMAVMRRVGEHLRAGRAVGELLDLEEGVALVGVEDVDEETFRVPLSRANQLLEEQTWPG